MNYFEDSKQKFIKHIQKMSP